MRVSRSKKILPRLSPVLCFLLLVLFYHGGQALAKDPAEVFLPIRFVADGDTIILEDHTVVRLIGINAPENGGKGKPVEPLGPEAETYLKSLLEGRSIRLELDRETLDRYGRTLAYAYLPDGRMVNELVLEAGLAYCLCVAPNTLHFNELLKKQRAAMDAKKGLWGLFSEKPALYVGNPWSMRVHLPGHLAPTSRRIRFSRLWDAFYNGYAPCGSCLKNWHRTALTLPEKQNGEAGFPASPR